jgi:hypothetical protein
MLGFLQGIWVEKTLWQTYKKLLNMAIEVVDLHGFTHFSNGGFR